MTYASRVSCQRLGPNPLAHLSLETDILPNTATQLPGYPIIPL